MSFPSYFYEINTFFPRIFRAKMLILAFDRLIYSLIILCIQNLPQNIFDLSPTPGSWLNRLTNFIKIIVTTPKPPNKTTHTSPTLKFLSLLQNSHSFEFVFIHFVSHKIGLKMLSGTFFRIGLSLLEAEIWRFLWWHFVGYSLYVLLLSSTNHQTDLVSLDGHHPQTLMYLQEGIWS